MTDTKDTTITIRTLAGDQVGRAEERSPEWGFHYAETYAQNRQETLYIFRGKDLLGSVDRTGRRRHTKAYRQELILVREKERAYRKAHPTPRKSRTEAEWKEKGYSRITLRIPALVLDLFRANAKRDKLSLTAYITERVIDAEDYLCFTRPLYEAHTKKDSK